MAKIFGLFGSMTGKLADTVMSVRNGEQIARKYQPIVFNPSTPKQVAVRARMKLLSQMSAVMAPVIAIPRRGTVTSRNIFTKINYRNTTFADNSATAQLEAIQLTDSVVGLPNVGAERGEGTIIVYLVGGASIGSLDVDRVVYSLFLRGNDNSLRFVDSQVSSTPGTPVAFSANFADVTGDVVIYAYGVRDNTEAARVTFDNLSVPTAQMVATLITSRTLTESDVTLTETKAFILAADSRDIVPTEKSSKKK